MSPHCSAVVLQEPKRPFPAAASRNGGSPAVRLPASAPGRSIVTSAAVLPTESALCGALRTDRDHPLRSMNCFLLINDTSPIDCSPSLIVFPVFVRNLFDAIDILPGGKCPRPRQGIRFARLIPNLNLSRKTSKLIFPPEKFIPREGFTPSGPAPSAPPPGKFKIAFPG